MGCSGSVHTSVEKDVNEIVECSWPTDKVSNGFPLNYGEKDLPENMQGLWWLTKQDSGSSLITFGLSPEGKTGGAKRYNELKGQMQIEVVGDRTWTFAHNNLTGNLNKARRLDLVYEFNFKPEKGQEWEEGKQCNFAQIHPIAMDVELDNESLVDFEMTFKSEGAPEYPGCPAWSRTSEVLGSPTPDHDYHAIQVIDGDGKKLEPAWSAWKKAMDSKEAGDSPGRFWFLAKKQWKEENKPDTDSTDEKTE